MSLAALTRLAAAVALGLALAVPAVPAAAAEPTLAAAGDIVGDCVGSACGYQQTARDISALGPTLVLALGDVSNRAGETSDYTSRFNGSWGAFKPRIRPVPGNHDYLAAGARNFFAYFGAVARPPRGYYSFDVGSWHVVAINSNCSHVGGCQAGSAQERWLRADLAQHRTACTLAFWHHPRYSSGIRGDSTAMKPIFQALYDARADVVLSGHAHDYERFAPQDNAGRLDVPGGVRQFVVGTGGASHTHRWGAIQPNSQVRNNRTFGVLQLTLGAGSYRWRFAPVAGASFTDSGTAACHHAA